MGILDRLIPQAPAVGVVRHLDLHGEQLTQAERTVYDQIIGIYRCRTLLPQLRDRCFPLIVGPSGAGKTTTVRTAVDQIRQLHGREHPGSAVAYLELNAIAWIPSGAEEPTTLRLLFDAMSLLKNTNHGLLIVFLDELDKLLNTSRDNHNAAWHRCAMQEIQAVVSRSAGVLLRYGRRWLPFRGPGRTTADAMLRNALLIGAGAFQDAYRKRNGIFSMDALKPAKGSDHLLFENHSKRCVFNGDDFQLFSRCQWIILRPPSPDELRRAANVMIDGPMRGRLQKHLDVFLDMAATSQSPLRALESLIMLKCLDLLKSEGQAAITFADARRQPGGAVASAFSASTQRPRTPETALPNDSVSE